MLVTRRTGALHDGLYRHTLSVVKRMEIHLVRWAYDVDYRFAGGFSRRYFVLPMQWRQRVGNRDILASDVCAGNGSEKTDR